MIHIQDIIELRIVGMKQSQNDKSVNQSFAVNIFVSLNRIKTLK